MPKKLYQVDVRVYATAYIKARSRAEAQRIADGLTGCCVHVGTTEGEIPISDLPYSHPDLPDLSAVARYDAVGAVRHCRIVLGPSAQ